MKIDLSLDCCPYFCLTDSRQSFRSSSTERFLSPPMPGLVPRVSGSLRSGLSLQSYIERVAQPTPVPCIAGLMEKLDRAEARDLILCTLHLLHFLPRKILTAIISHFESNGLVLNFISLLRVALDFFKYHGKTYTIQATSNK
ncbi:unnamed protein product [Gongylonema pulchrum]|uniref:Symplekin_C domain-containing protein n=1 Tax=Gongylonema pulchrum TaxID=637853 RepID=A0A183D7L7_9BILA|nr:unnamed protein product [Gongylonema pulchrum]